MTVTRSADSTQTSLLRAVADGTNQNAWQQFAKVYVPLIQHFATRWGLQEADAHDVVQETLLRIRQLLADGKYDPAKGRFRSWLRGIVIHRILSALEMRNRPTRARGNGGMEVDALIDSVPIQGQDSLEASWDSEWNTMILRFALDHARATVGDTAYEAFKLHALDGWPAEQVADHLGLAPSTVYVYKRRVLQAARQRAEEFEDN
jgi:RNA polymerase sigma-70 factor (ECF subfamily)